jgi:hypothetical protein
VKSVQGMYRSVIHQLYAKIPRIKAAASRRVTVAKQQVWSIKILEDMLRESVLGLASDEKVTIYIDALDECEIDQVRSAVDFFEGLSRSATREEKPFFICLSSRYYPQITMQCHAEVKLDTLTEHAEDITTFLASNFTLQSPFRSELQAEIEKRCSGIFLWVVLVVQMLKRDHDKGATRSQLRETLRSLSHELSELFSRITKLVGPEFAVAMRWVLCARSSLDPKELYFAIQSSSKISNSNSLCWDMAEIDMDAIRKYILHVSRGLIECTLLRRESNEEAVQFVHESVREYLLSRDLAIPSSVSLRKLDITSHAKMAEDCRNYLEHCAGCQFMKLSPVRMSKSKYSMLELFYDSHPLIIHALNHALTYCELAYNDGTVKSNVIDDFPINDYITTWNICSAIGRWAPLKMYGSPIIEGHPAVLLNLLICQGCNNLVEVMLRSTVSNDRRLPYKRYRRPVKPSTVTGLDLRTCCGGPAASPLHAAVETRIENLVRLLLNKGADVNMSGDPRTIARIRYRSPLTSAVRTGSVAMVKLLLDQGAHVNTLEPLPGWSVLHVACDVVMGYSLDLATIKLLLSQGARVNLRSNLRKDNPHYHESSTPLHLVCCTADEHWKTSAAALMLLSAGADVNATDNNDITPLISAAALGNLEAVKVLLDHGANTEYRSTTHGTALTAASPEILQDLAYEIRTRALKGQNAHPRTAPQLGLARAGKPSLIPVPASFRSRRAETTLHYRYPPWRRRLDYYPRAGDYMYSSSEGSEADDTDTASEADDADTESES